ncbi:hypothetical protein Clacol_002742 [Clathrus columnatus]|uniref:Glycosyl transferase CAP10 domain-containing protein n=1 Tax=Clathrus columnatus TaxID=1419009 RepID=A0AAV5A5K0_9AGAM|nr:hypothetical protein Clacol_002742 [Clathrus columnatus]
MSRQKRPVSQPDSPDRVEENDPFLDRDSGGPSNPKVKTPLSSRSHFYRTDGLLEVNPKGRHPIYELIDTAEIQWKRKLQKQSKTLEQAVKEYKRRYKRLPPKGFNLWWDYADYYNVQLRDEYDSIHRQLQPLWGIRPEVLQRLQHDAESQYDSFTIGKIQDSSRIELLNDTLSGNVAYGKSGHSRLQDLLAMLEEIQEWLPEFRATFNMHDIPRGQVSWEARYAAEVAAEKGEYVDTSNIQSPALGWSAVCPPDSALRSFVAPPFPDPDDPVPEYHDSYQTTSSNIKTFIYNHILTMSPCDHPNLLLLNGALSGYHYSSQFGPTPWSEFTPIFSMSSTFLNFDILHPAAEAWMSANEIAKDAGGEDQVLKWDDMYDERLLWRGSTTGAHHAPGRWWNVSQRTRLVESATRRGGETRVLFPPLAGRDAAVGFGRTLKYSALNSAFMDVAFSGSPQQCEEKTCSLLKQRFEFRKRMSYKEAGAYKYVMDIDGNGWSSRFKRLISTNSLVFKATIFPEWYSERIMPWVHYVPVQYTLTDLYDILAFFRGSPFSNIVDAETEPDMADVENIDILDPEREFLGNDRLARRIATAGREWSDTFFRKEDMTAYMYRLLLEYARVMNLDREAATMHE